jgi:hypothetical protein
MNNQLYEHFSYVLYELEYPMPIVQHDNDKSIAKKSKNKINNEILTKTNV